MAKEDLSSVTDMELSKKSKSSMTLMIIFVFLILGLGYYVYDSYVSDGSINKPLLVITICTIGGMAAVVGDYLHVQAEIKKRAKN